MSKNSKHIPTGQDQLFDSSLLNGDIEIKGTKDIDEAEIKKDGALPVSATVVVEAAPPFPEEFTEGQEPNRYTKEEGEKIDKEMHNNSRISFEEAYYRATGRRYIYPPKRRPRSSEPKPQPLRGRLATHADATRDGEEGQHLR